MNLSVFLLLVHIFGAIGYSAGTLMSLFGLLALRRVERVEQARSILKLMDLPGPVSGISLLLVVATGLYMTITLWGWQTGWIDVALGSLVVLLLPTGAVMGTHRQAIARLANEMPDGPLPESLKQHIYDPFLGTSTVLLNALLLGIIFLMVVKPDLVTSMIVIGVSVGLGLVFSLPIWREEQRVSKTVDPT
jgi:hypothetical protein